MRKGPDPRKSFGDKAPQALQKAFYRLVLSNEVGKTAAFLQAHAEAVGWWYSTPGTATYSALHLCAMHGSADMAALLLKAGANPNARNRHGDTPLVTGIKYHDKTVLPLLLAKGARHDIGDAKGTSPLMLAAQRRSSPCVAALLKAGADIHARSRRKATPLHYAATGGDGETVRLLLEAGAGFTTVDIQGKMPADYARHEGWYDMAKLIDGFALQVETDGEQENIVWLDRLQESFRTAGAAKAVMVGKPLKLKQNLSPA